MLSMFPSLTVTSTLETASRRALRSNLQRGGKSLELELAQMCMSRALSFQRMKVSLKTTTGGFGGPSPASATTWSLAEFLGKSG